MRYLHRPPKEKNPEIALFESQVENKRLADRVSLADARIYDLECELKHKDMFIDKLQADVAALLKERKWAHQFWLSEVVKGMQLEDLEKL
jgi:uncharacterized coiled-coil protein SlyX